MRKFNLFLITMMMAACASIAPKSSEELAKAPNCNVWKDGLIGSKTVIEVKGEVAKQKRSCWILNMFWCDYTDYEFRPNGTEILSSLPPADKTIATLNGNKMTVSMKGVDVDPFELKADHADIAYKGVFGPKQTAKVQFSPSCSKKQAALGLLTVFTR